MATTSIRIDERLVKQANIVADIESRSVPKQIEHWAKIGRIMEDNPELSYDFVEGVLKSKAESDAGLIEEYTFG